MKAFALSSKAAVRGGARVGVSSPARAPVAGRRVPGALEVSCKAKQGQELNGRWCRITGKTANNGYSVSHSHIRTKKLQGVNLHVKKIYWPRGERWVKLRVSTKGMKTVQKKGIEAAAKDAGIDLWKLPFVLDESEARKQWKKQMGRRRELLSYPKPFQQWRSCGSRGRRRTEECPSSGQPHA